MAQGWLKPHRVPWARWPQARQPCQQGQLAVQEVLSRDVTPPPPEQEFGVFFFFFLKKEAVMRKPWPALSSSDRAMCPHPSPSPTGIIFRVCLPHSVPAHFFCFRVTRTSLPQLPRWHTRNHSPAWRTFPFPSSDLPATGTAQGGKGHSSALL